MAEQGIVLKALLKQRHQQGHAAFVKEYNRLAKQIEPELVGTYPSKAQFYRWLSGELLSLPYAHHCRVLEGMFPGWTAEQLFQSHEGGIEFLPEPPTKPQQRPSHIAPTPAGMRTAHGHADIVAVFPTRSEFMHDMPPHRLFNDARRVRMVGLSLNLLTQQYTDRALTDLLESGATIEALFLDPAGENIKTREQEEGHSPGLLSTLTTVNIQALQRIGAMLSDQARDNLMIRTYDEPVRFNITVIDDATCIVQPYLPYARGVESPTMVMDHQSDTSGLYDTFVRVFDSMWARSKELSE
jgi:hypothetical protein